ncbi:hypothetical protein E2C01_092812 [Portunus trituberculatus]|uniref:Uncharacterized protein n=1 Tax=Portunus trituberculatus TaxID=210409 RepID=A0A5B7JYQ7_PORTR|nr:hypothetical protein [Portunus trituberculatus]
MIDTSTIRHPPPTTPSTSTSTAIKSHYVRERMTLRGARGSGSQGHVTQRRHPSPAQHSLRHSPSLRSLKETHRKRRPRTPKLGKHTSWELNV